ncbi:MAG: hypothetical protein HGA46_00865 [Chlorobiaceae bacterium]|nr:hypothetical protein [Chlorobiaceae bacterium]
MFKKEKEKANTRLIRRYAMYCSALFYGDENDNQAEQSEKPASLTEQPLRDSESLTGKNKQHPLIAVEQDIEFFFAYTSTFFLSRNLFAVSSMVFSCITGYFCGKLNGRERPVQ